MEGDVALRLFHPKHYSWERSRFNSMAARVSHDGLSVVDEACARRCSGSECRHIPLFYEEHICGDPPVFRRLRPNEYANAALTQDTTASGDTCHFLITGLAKNFDKYLVKNTEIAQLRICIDGVERELTLEDIRNQSPPQT